MPRNKVMQAAVGGSAEGSIPSIEYPSPILPPPENISPVVRAAKGGSIKNQTQLLLKRGGMMDDGGTKDPISGNEVPIGAMQEEVRDDVPAQLSEGEFVIPADVVRYIGLERLMMMRQAAKEGLKKMEEMGQMSNAEEATLEDDGEFESEIDDILSELDSDEEDEGEDKETKMAEGGMVDPAVAQTQQALAQDQQPRTPALTEDQLAFIQKTAERMREQKMEVPPEQQSMPTEGLKASDIIRDNLSQSQSPEQIDAYLQKIAKLEKTKKLVNLRHNDTVVLGFVKAPGVVDPAVFSTNDPEKFDAAITSTIAAMKKAGIKRLESSSKDTMALEYLTAKGLPVEQGSPDSGFTWALDL